MPEAQIAIIGGGIIGLAHAWYAARQGLRVVVFERNEYAQGASIGNFGMILPIGQPPGERLDLALRSQCLWLEAARDAGIEIASRGSIHVAYRDDEAAVIHEFAEAGSHYGYQCRWMDA